MTHLTVLAEGIPLEPPPHVTSEVIWRLASRLWHDHEHDRNPIPRCTGCGKPWPCSGRRLALLGLIQASR